MIADIIFDIVSIIWFVVFFGCIFIATLDIHT